MDHSKNDCFVLVLMTHGTDNGLLGAFDGYFDGNELFDLFLSNNCKTLVGKPKLFFVQACHGEKYDRRKEEKHFKDSIDNSSSATITLPSTADQLIMYVTPEGFASWPNNTNGSWFIQELCYQLETNFKDDLVFMLRRVRKKVAIKTLEHTSLQEMGVLMLMPITISSLSKKIFFHKPTNNK